MGLYVRHPSSLEHDTGAHPENAGRIRAIESALDARDWLGLDLAEAPSATPEQLARIHPETHIERIAAICESGGGMIDMDTVTSPGSWEAALHSAGGAAWAADQLLDGATDFAFCAMRPPGHHAETDRAMGFCLFNNVAVAAAQALQRDGVERVFILDWDVHHGNGTEEIFQSRSDVLYASIHESPQYPGTGAIRDTGFGDGVGYTLNLPVPPGSGSETFLSLVQHVVAPVLRSYDPQLVIVSAGYDAHSADPLAYCELDTDCYADMTAVMRELSAEVGAPLMVCLEGGYDLDALSDSVVATIAALGGSEPSREASVEPADAYRRAHANHWGVLAEQGAADA